MQTIIFKYTFPKTPFEIISRLIDRICIIFGFISIYLCLYAWQIKYINPLIYTIFNPSNVWNLALFVSAIEYFLAYIFIVLCLVFLINNLFLQPKNTMYLSESGLHINATSGCFSLWRVRRFYKYGSFTCNLSSVGGLYFVHSNAILSIIETNKKHTFFNKNRFNFVESQALNDFIQILNEKNTLKTI